ncbi:hypothetical protein CUMW_288410, partial [Citrus unshiu]
MLPGADFKHMRVAWRLGVVLAAALSIRLLTPLQAGGTEPPALRYGMHDERELATCPH